MDGRTYAQPRATPSQSRAGDGAPQQQRSYAQPLTLHPGTHRVEIQVTGYEPVMFDVNVMPGPVITSGVRAPSFER